MARRRGASWDLVDVVAAGARRFPGTVREASERLGISSGNFSQYLNLSRTYPPFRRLNSVGISIYIEGLRLAEADRDRLIDAAAGGLTYREARAFARELKGEAERMRLRAEVAELRRRLRAAEQDPADVARRSTRRVRDAARAAIGAYRDLAAVVVEVCEEPVLRGLHGNARRGLSTTLRRDIERVATAADAAVDQRIRPALLALEGSG